MKRSVAMTVLILAFASGASAAKRDEPALKTGDVVLQTSKSGQSDAIQRATHSPFSHVGIVEVTKSGPVVIEAVGPVKVTPWKAWRDRGVGAKVLVLRAKHLGSGPLEQVIAEAKKHLKKPYDYEFRWDDKAMYCSELVYKAFDRGAGIEVGRKERLADLSIKGLERELAARYRGKVPKDLELVTPASIASDADLEPVFSTFPEVEVPAHGEAVAEPAPVATP